MSVNTCMTANGSGTADPAQLPIVNGVMYGADEFVGMFVASRLRTSAAPAFDLPMAANGQRLYAALGVVRPIAGRQIMLGGVVFSGLHSHNGKPVCIECSAAFDRANWVTRGSLYQLFKYPFLELGCATLLARIRKRNHRARKFCEGLGFRLVGPVPRAFDGVEDLMLYAMTREQCRWLKERENGKIIAPSACAS